MSVQVDIESWINALEAGIGLVPPVLIAIVLLGGPTAGWLLYRFVVQPRTMRLRGLEPGAMWVCANCRSVNEVKVSRCYRCGAPLDEHDLELIDAHPAGPVRLMSVGPGLNLGRRMTGGDQSIPKIERAAAVWIEDETWEVLEAQRDRAALPDRAAMTEIVEAPYRARSARPPTPIPIAPARRAAARPSVVRPRRVVAAGPVPDPDDTPAA